MLACCEAGRPFVVPERLGDPEGGGWGRGFEFAAGGHEPVGCLRLRREEEEVGVGRTSFRFSKDTTQFGITKRKVDKTQRLEARCGVSTAQFAAITKFIHLRA